MIEDVVFLIRPPLVLKRIENPERTFMIFKKSGLEMLILRKKGGRAFQLLSRCLTIKAGNVR
jgi:hypothetical protein